VDRGETPLTVQRRGPGSRAGGDHPTRLELLDAAAAIAGDRGIEALTVAAVTNSAGHAKGTFYVHFDDRTELLTELHRRFHDTLFESIRHSTAGMTAGPERAAARIEGFLDGCRDQPTVRAMLLEAQSLPEIAELVRRRNDEAAADLSSELRGFTPHPKETARLLVSATIEVAMQELSAGRRLQRLRSALLDLIPKKKPAQA
jgi:TetR/AcrR family transcriptional repressor of nem operon